jgi:hypothetical protein
MRESGGDKVKEDKNLGRERERERERDNNRYCERDRLKDKE